MLRYVADAFVREEDCFKKMVIKVYFCDICGL
jgi:hypothetical protein